VSTARDKNRGYWVRRRDIDREKRAVGGKPAVNFLYIHPKYGCYVL